MNKIVEELRNAGVFHVATVDAEGHPHVRPFAAVAEFEGRAYICTNNTKRSYAEMLANPQTELCGVLPNGDWIRVTAKLVRDDRDEARAAMIEANETIKVMYHVGDGIMEVFYLEDATCKKYSFTSDPVIIQ